MSSENTTPPHDENINAHDKNTEYGEAGQKKNKSAEDGSASKSLSTLLNSAAQSLSAIAGKTANIASKAKNISKNITIEDILVKAILIQGVRIDRADFLRKELRKHYPEGTVELAVSRNPASAGISRKEVNTLAVQSINLETAKVTAISAAAGIPGGFAMAATVPADLAQYFGFVLRIMQKLTYLYGFPDFELKDDSIDDATLNQVLIFTGVMFGVQEANAAIKAVAQSAATHMSKTLARKALTKTAVYPIVKKAAKITGIRMTKQIFAESVSKAIPLIGGAVSGAVTYMTFKPSARKLKSNLEQYRLSDPEFYKAAPEPNASSEAHNDLPDHG